MVISGDDVSCSVMFGTLFGVFSVMWSEFLMTMYCMQCCMSVSAVLLCVDVLSGGGLSNECDEPTSCLVQPIGAHGGEVMYFGCVCFKGEFGFLNCDDVCRE